MYIYTIIAGDFNLVLDQVKDTYNYINIYNPKSRKILQDLILNNNMIDIYSHINPQKLEYTWQRRNPVKKARLDYFIISPTLTDLIDKAQIIPTIDWTDHSFIQIHIIPNQFIRGKGTWKLNCGLLYNENYINLVNTTIDNIKLEYTAPNFKNITIWMMHPFNLQSLISCFWKCSF